MRLDIKWVECDGVDGAVVPGNFWSCGGGFAWFARGGARQLLGVHYRSTLQFSSSHFKYVFFSLYLMRSVIGDAFVCINTQANAIIQLSSMHYRKLGCFISIRDMRLISSLETRH
jgi:hypothetical protein